jgi:hypothetical protein
MRGQPMHVHELVSLCYFTLVHLGGMFERAAYTADHAPHVVIALQLRQSRCSGTASSCWRGQARTLGPVARTATLATASRWSRVRRSKSTARSV